MTSHRRPSSNFVTAAAALLLSVAALLGASSLPAGAAATRPSPRSAAHASPLTCAPSGRAVGFSDRLDKLSVAGVTVGGLSSLAYDSQRRAWASAVDNHASDPARIWFFRNLSAPHGVGGPLVLRRPDGTPFSATQTTRVLDLIVRLPVNP